MRVYLSLALLVLFSAAALAQSCDPLECASRTRIASDPFCRNDDVYATYQEYFCDGKECTFRATERLIEDCKLGCAVSSCITCEQKACEANSGFYGSRFCRGVAVYQPYREYFCDTGRGCTFSETNRLVESCPGDSTCSQGKCGLCDPANCAANSNFYGDNFCNAGTVYREYRTYKCSGDKCQYSSQDVKLAGCAYGCNDDECALPSCEPGCESKDALVGEPFCKGSSVYQLFRNYFCGVLRCEFNETERKISDCQSCSNGQCTITKAKNERVIEFDVKFSVQKAERNVSAMPSRVFNGVLFGRNDMDITANAFVKSVSFDVLDTNSLGKLRVFADGRNVMNASGVGHYDVAVNGNARRLTLSAESSGFVFWMPGVYDVGSVTAVVIEESAGTNSFQFRLSRAELDNLKSAEIIAQPADARVSINGNGIAGNAIGRNILGLDNAIEFTPLLNETSSGKGAIKIVY